MQSSCQQLKLRLLKHLDNDYNVLDMQGVLDAVSVLETFPITKEILEQTRLGLYVNEMRRKTTDVVLQKRAKGLVRQWQSVAAQSMAPTPAVTPVSSPTRQKFLNGKLKNGHSTNHDNDPKSSCQNGHTSLHDNDPTSSLQNGPVNSVQTSPTHSCLDGPASTKNTSPGKLNPTGLPISSCPLPLTKSSSLQPLPIRTSTAKQKNLDISRNNGPVLKTVCIHNGHASLGDSERNNNVSPAEMKARKNGVKKSNWIASVLNGKSSQVVDEGKRKRAGDDDDLSSVPSKKLRKNGRHNSVNSERLGPAPGPLNGSKVNGSSLQSDVGSSRPSSPVEFRTKKKRQSVATFVELVQSMHASGNLSLYSSDTLNAIATNRIDKEPDDIGESCVPAGARPVTDGDIERYRTANVAGLTGQYDDGGEFHRWTDTYTVAGHGGVLLHVLPYATADQTNPFY